MKKVQRTYTHASFILLCVVPLIFVGCNSAPFLDAQSGQAQTATAKCYQQFGVTLSGAEGVGNDYTRPTEGELRYYASKGVRLIRLEVRWDKLQPELLGSLNEDELTWVKSFVTYAHQLKIEVDIDLHQRANYDDLNFGDSLKSNDLADFWKKFAGALVQAHIQGICGFGIANEPDNEPPFYGRWPVQVNPVIAALRRVDTQHFLFVGQDQFDPSISWQPTEATSIHDPANMLVFEAHSYWDNDGSGNYNPDIPPADSVAAKNLVIRNLMPFIQWCQKTRNRCFVGEFGVPPDQTWLDALDAALQYMKRNNIYGCYWAGGPGYDDILSIEPVNGKDSSQMHVLEKYLV
jgi:endoglucanase